VRAALAVPFADVRAASLRHARDLPPQPALAVRRLAVAGRRLELRLLGASHQVLVLGPGGVAASETVACTAAGVALPEAVDDGGYRFRATVRRLDPVELDAEVAGLRDALTDDPLALLGEFPGHASSVTAVLAEPDGLGWRTWHAYPQAGELVVTATRIAP
jgi:hypothetical protein